MSAQKKRQARWSRPGLPFFWPVWKEGSNKPSQEPISADFERLRVAGALSRGALRQQRLHGIITSVRSLSTENRRFFAVSGGWPGAARGMANHKARISQALWAVLRVELGQEAAAWWLGPAEESPWGRPGGAWARGWASPARLSKNCRPRPPVRRQSGGREAAWRVTACVSAQKVHKTRNFPHENARPSDIVLCKRARGVAPTPQADGVSRPPFPHRPAFCAARKGAAVMSVRID